MGYAITDVKGRALVNLTDAAEILDVHRATLSDRITRRTWLQHPESVVINGKRWCVLDSVLSLANKAKLRRRPLASSKPIPSSIAELSSAQAAAILGVTEGTLRVWRHCGRGPAWYMSAHRVVYRRGDVEAFKLAKYGRRMAPTEIADPVKRKNLRAEKEMMRSAGKEYDRRRRTPLPALG